MASHLLTTDLNTETVTSNHYEVFLSFHLQSLCPNLCCQLLLVSTAASYSGNLII
jgi:hypothetical protein